MSEESLSISLLLRHNLPVNRKALGDSLSFVKESVRSALDLREPPPPLVLLDWPCRGGRTFEWLPLHESPEGPGVWGAESQEEFVAALFSRVAQFSGGIVGTALRSVFWMTRTLIRTMDRRWSFSSDRSAEWT